MAERQQPGRDLRDQGCLQKIQVKIMDMLPRSNKPIPAACADFSWIRRIRFLAKIEEKRKEAPKMDAQDALQKITGNRNRSSWHNKN